MNSDFELLNYVADRGMFGGGDVDGQLLVT